MAFLNTLVVYTCLKLAKTLFLTNQFIVTTLLRELLIYE